MFPKKRGIRKTMTFINKALLTIKTKIPGKSAKADNQYHNKPDG